MTSTNNIELGSSYVDRKIQIRALKVELQSSEGVVIEVSSVPKGGCGKCDVTSAELYRACIYCHSATD